MLKNDIEIINDVMSYSVTTIESLSAWNRIKTTLVEAQNTPTNKPSAEISALIAELYSNKPADRMYSREEVIAYLKRAETSPLLTVV